jgi:hypothetical protein
VEGLAFLKPLHVAFVSLLGERFSLKGSGLRLLGLFPFTRSYLSHRIPIGVTATGVYVLTEHNPTEAALYERETFEFYPYDQLSELRLNDATVYWDGETTTRFPSANFAAAVVEEIRELSDLSEKKRRAKLDKKYSKCFDLNSLAHLRESLEGPLGWLSNTSSAAFYLLLLFLPLMVYTDWVSTRTLVFWLVLLILANGGVAYMGYRLIRKMRSLRLSAGFDQLLWFLLYPPAAIHAASKMAREIFRSYDYLTVAASTLSRGRLLSVLRAELYGITHALKSCTEPSWQEYWERRQQAILALLQRVELSEPEALRPPVRKDPVAARFCPVCEMEYLERATICTECQFDLVELEPS